MKTDIFESDDKTALILAGGGARGAFQVGVLEVLAEKGLDPDIIAGTSIGALNGAFVAQSGEFSQTTSDLTRAWREIGQKELIQVDVEEVLRLIGRTLGTLGPAGVGGKLTLKAFTTVVSQVVKQFMKKNEGLIKSEDLESFVYQRLDAERIRNGTPLKLAVTPVDGSAETPEGRILAAFKAKFEGDVDYLDSRALEDEQLIRSILASAAIPGVLPARNVEDKDYSDGGLQDNIPVKSIKEENCDRIVVVHVSNGNVWEPGDSFESTPVLEVRPIRPLYEPVDSVYAWAKSLLKFEPDYLDELQQHGRDSTEQLLGMVDKFSELSDRDRELNPKLADSTEELMDDSPLLEDFDAEGFEASAQLEQDLKLDE